MKNVSSHPSMMARGPLPLEACSQPGRANESGSVRIRQRRCEKPLFFPASVVAAAAQSLRLAGPGPSTELRFERAYGVEGVSLLVEEETGMCVFDGGTQRAGAGEKLWVRSLPLLS